MYRKVHKEKHCDIVEKIGNVWGKHDDFVKGGFPYVAFLIQQDVKDMGEEEWDERECVEELADVCINAIRLLVERGYSPHQVIMNRLDNHKEKGTEQLIAKYQKMYRGIDVMGGE